MATFNPALAIALIERNAASFGTDQAEQDTYIREAKARLGSRSSEDQREATKLAVETAKMILTIGVGILVATGTFVQFAHTGGLPWGSWTNLLFTGTAVTILLSMTCGFRPLADHISAPMGGKPRMNPPGPRRLWHPC